ncbi:class I SAM-dependent methyltransferase [Aliifodinibius sp. S!AR15-10]|uniref:class I SAM-dependent methyltransferase n=1 Tax=Aliifodinibius sp. S!AR15-10 TaxID=2950437 RepID=UPI002856E8E6|nr:class I SAM-dependent methyltransferase [Aliifodinibius sp. S!AR15-10]MDR8392902.1 class I SAM-dependent methyltransferase [Aliifodinibius sp. S!AR15-10]
MEDRRQWVSFDPRHFEKEKRDKDQDIRSTFQEIYLRNHWAGEESISGEGAGSNQTKTLRAELPKLLEYLKIRTLLDLPCGDLSWISDLDLPVDHYIGADIVPELISQNRDNFQHSNKEFEVLDLTTDPLPKADLILCRDCLVHLSFRGISKAVQNLKTSSITWLITTTFTECDRNEDISTGDWRPLNLQKAPFSFPPPERLINEECTEGDGKFSDKCLGLWKIEALPEITLSP